MIKKTLASALLISGIAFSSASQATLFDFAAIANDQTGLGAGADYTYNAGFIPGEAGYDPLEISRNGITVTVTGSSLDAPIQDYFAYLDKDLSGTKVAGLGVCKKLTTDLQCDVPSDDNVTKDEVLHLSFNGEVKLDTISFRNASHLTEFGDFKFLVSIDGGTAIERSLSDNFAEGITGQHFDFWLADQDTKSVYNQLYISSITVPAPAPLALLALGLLGVYSANKKRKTA